MTEKKIGFIGQGYVGKNYADDFERRGFSVVRYALEKRLVKNGSKIKECPIVFIAVPTPTTPRGFNDSILRRVIKLVGKGNTAVIKSTILPGTTESIQAQNPDIFVLHSPEFLTEANASADASNPLRNIIGISKSTVKYKKAAEKVMQILPKAPYEAICRAREAELIKYGGNCWFYFKVVFINMLYDISQELGADWSRIKEAMCADPRIGETHLDPLHKSGRGAGGNCFIKDFAAFSELYGDMVGDEKGRAVLDSIVRKNIDFLRGSEKDLHILEQVYGKAAK